MAHIRIFGYQVWVLVTEPKRYTIGPHRQEGIYVGFDSKSIIRYLGPTTGALFRARFANCRFLEFVFPTLRAVPKPKYQDLNFIAPKILTMNPDPPTALSNTEVIKLLNLKSLAENTPDGFSSEPRIIRHPLPGTGTNLPKRYHENPTLIHRQPKRAKSRFTAEHLQDLKIEDRDKDIYFGEPSEPKILKSDYNLDTNPATLK